MPKLLSLLKNKYFLSTTAFLVWMLFFDRNDLLSQYEYRSQLQKLEQEKQFYTQEIAKVQKDLDELTTNKDKLEKFAREHYLMKRDNEDVFVIIEETIKE
ncbi:FtsB family cell division protein [Pedobacter glucosidilyticus]|uniref:FtsB family cell division protein n=1 Tax=Pedobacter glucosidilyticus TaxID=1122941 RepID=UPI00047C045C|nr:septum formation initiator family protein [Pedobacter glucosidilyticus]